MFYLDLIKRKKNVLPKFGQISRFYFDRIRINSRMSTRLSSYKEKHKLY